MMKIVYLLVLILFLSSNLFGYDSVLVSDFTAINAQAMTTSYGATTTNELYSTGSSTNRNILARIDVGSVVVPADSVFAACTLYVEVASIALGPFTYDVYELLVPWTESATWLTYDGTTSWSVSGGEGNGTDRANTNMVESGVFSSASTYYKIPISSSTFLGWLSGDVTNNGVQITRNIVDSKAITLSSDDHGTDYPYALIYFAPAGTVASQVIITE